MIRHSLRRWFIIACALAGVAACSGHSHGVLPMREGPPPQAALVLVWVGYGEASRFEGGIWRRVPEFDYEFTVEQRRYPDRWESVKHMRRRHPRYDGSAGPRELTYYFRVEFEPSDASDRVLLRIASTLGPGHGASDREFRQSTLTIRADVSPLAPFDTYRIDQQYRYEQGILEETVRLDKGSSPWVRNHERARLFAEHMFSSPPTRR
jgi:hypothetical protein